MNTYSLSAAALGLMAAGAFAADPPAAPAPPPPQARPAGPHQSIDQRLDDIAAKIGLSDVQKGELKILMIQRQERVRMAARAAQRSLRAQVRTILTPEQWTQLEAYMQAHRPAGHPPGGPAADGRAPGGPKT